MSRLAAAAIVLVALAVLGAACGGVRAEVPTWERPGLYGAVRPEMGSPQPGDAAPDFTLAREAGSPFRLADLRGSWVVLHFTATWCPFCDAEVEHLGELAADLAPRGVTVVLVDVQDDEDRWRSYSKEHVPPSVVALRDGNGDVARRYAPPHAQPSFEDRAQVVLDSTLVVDGEGRIRLFLLPDSKHFDPAFRALRAELERMLPSHATEPAVLSPEKVVTLGPGAALTAPGGRGELAIALTVAPSYHLMSDRPSAPEYIPTRVRIDAVDGVTLGDPAYPAPVPFRLAERDIATFQGEVTIRVPYSVAPGAAPGARRVTGSLRYQSCTATRCLFPVTRPFEATLTVMPAQGAGRP